MPAPLAGNNYSMLFATFPYIYLRVETVSKARPSIDTFLPTAVNVCSFEQNDSRTRILRHSTTPFVTNGLARNHNTAELQLPLHSPLTSRAGHPEAKLQLELGCMNCVQAKMRGADRRLLTSRNVLMKVGFKLQHVPE